MAGIKFGLSGFVCTLALSLTGAAVGQAAAADAERAYAMEVNTATAAAMAVVSGLQPKINSGTLQPSEFVIDDLIQEMKANYQDRTGQIYGASADARIARFKSDLEQSMRTVLTDFSDVILDGGQDVFVPAFFRAELLIDVSAQQSGGFNAVVTTRDSELINSDSAVSAAFEDEAIVGFLNGLLENGHDDASDRVFDDTLVAYFPMTLRQACVECHTRSGLDQEVGAFGGAFVIAVPLEP